MVDVSTLLSIRNVSNVIIADTSFDFRVYAVNLVYFM